jgi:hypothetical protein
MSVADKPIARRSFVSGFVGVAALVGIAALEAPRLFPKLFRRRYPATPFDDLFALLPDRENAVRIGAVLRETGSRIDARTVAARLRKRIGGHSLALAIADDLTRNRLVEARGWLLPESLAELCILAAIVEHA